jgi:hypothetical protein
MPRYTFDEVKRALHEHWGLALRRGGEMGDGDARHDGRWTVEYSRTGYVIGGDLPGTGHGFRRYETLGQVVKSCDLEKVIGSFRR